ncbi:hypothetical protein ACT7DA_13805 [Bacillus pacificus]
MIKITIGKNQYPITLAEEHNFDWLKGVEVFTVLISKIQEILALVLLKMDIVTFLKYAGARNLEYKGNVADAIQRLMKAKKYMNKFNILTSSIY